MSRTADLTRQMLNVSWTGMTPSNTDATKLLVAVMQCRGYNPDRSDCWMAAPIGGSALTFVGSSYLPPEDSQWKQTRPVTTGMQYRIPFRKVDGTYHAEPNANIPGAWLVGGLGTKLPSGSTVDDYTPGNVNQRLGFTRSNGTGEVQTWANTKADNPSLGCSTTSGCSLVVVPINQHPCRTTPSVTQTELDRCIAATASQSNATAGYWQLLANWYQRYVFKMSFAPAGTACEQRDDSAEFLGSELMGEAMRRWVPARCQQSSPVGLDYTRAWEPEARTQIGQTDPIAPSGYVADAAVVTDPSQEQSVKTARKPAYAPIGVSGFAIGFNWEKSEAAGGGQVTDMKFSPRLVAKLLTQSYPGKWKSGLSPVVNPNAPTNPANILKDPEFLQLNPDAGQWTGESDAVGTQLIIPTARTDVMRALTQWIWSDPSAKAFLQGKADQWGMTVNKTYRGWELPRYDYDLRDGWVLPAGSDSAWDGFAPQQMWSQPSTSWANGSDALMTAWPLSQAPISPGQGLPFVPKRDLAQQPGFRHMIALSTTSELTKVGMRTASLQNVQGEYVAPSVESMTYALDGATPDQSTGVWKIDYTSMDKRGYPGTMISYAEVPTTTLKEIEAKQYADTIRWMSTDGQQYGQESGQLADGYLALTETMQTQASKVADAVEKQTGTPVIPPKNQDPIDDEDDETPDDPPSTQDPNLPGGSSTTTPPQNGDDGNGNGNGDGNGGGNGTNQPGGTSTTGSNGTEKPGSTPTTPGATPTPGQGKAPIQAAGKTKPASSETTQGDSLGWLSWGIPALLVAGLAAGVASPGIRLIAQPDHPVRRGIVAGGSYVASLVRRGRRRSG
ncbi:hypothetical protein [Kribbella caucasensis]|uniref:hypothetical protein n=1 Tax=Kribbella caucasensis TaxID=2512215 RepID=UPI00105DFDEB|nr:hypothetical protein [Kribbella sp. VKM Ac-2527]